MALMDDRGGYRVVKELVFPEQSVGLIYGTVNFHVGFRQGEEGKTMGLAAYGGPELFEQLRGRLRLYPDGGFDFMSPDEFKAALDAYVPARGHGAPMTPRHENVAYASQASLEAVVTNAFQAALRLTGATDLAYAGGVALNSVANEFARRAARPQRLYIATNPGDTGHALGCALYGAFEVAGWRPPRQEVREYLGPAYPLAELEAAAQASGYPVARPVDLAATLAQCIANGHIVARFDGGSEFGPRALGNRSILCDPRRPDMKDTLNARVKHREAFRPFAPTVLEEHAAQWFDLEGRSAYMLRVCGVPPEVRDRVPAIVHVDGTARVQTLARDENPGYWALIDAFHRLTGVPLVLNTSFNLAGKPIVETPADAVTCFASTEIDVLALGPWVLTKRPLAELLSEARPHGGEGSGQV
jgi:carbamoyltransferase